MKEWFTVEQLDSDTFAISEYGHWEQTHCYLLRGKDKALLIDTGLGVGNIRTVIDELTSLPVVVATTHVHWDHIGGHKHFEKFAVHENEKHWISGAFPLTTEDVKRNLTAKPCDFPDWFSIEAYSLFQGTPSWIFRDGDVFDLGDRMVQVIHTPGHSPGHCCFYEPRRKYLYSGDLIYQGCLDAFYPSTDPEQFFASVQKVRLLDIARIFPAHHALNIPVALIASIEEGFHTLKHCGKLEQGSGLFDFGVFQIHI